MDKDKKVGKTSSSRAINLARMGAIIICAAGIILICLGIVKLIVNNKPTEVTSNMNTTNGTITKVTTKNQNGSTVCRLSYTFNVDGKEYSSPKSPKDDDYTTSNCATASGLSIPVSYNPDNPNDNTATIASAEHLGISMAGVSMAVTGVILLVLGAIASHAIKQAQSSQQLNIDSLKEANIVDQTSHDEHYQ